MRRMELTLTSLRGYSKGAKSENGLLGCNVLGGFSFACYVPPVLFSLL